jgi:hypothetical protein
LLVNITQTYTLATIRLLKSLRKLMKQTRFYPTKLREKTTTPLATLTALDLDLVGSEAKVVLEVLVALKIFLAIFSVGLVVLESKKRKPKLKATILPLSWFFPF